MSFNMTEHFVDVYPGVQTKRPNDKQLSDELHDIGSRFLLSISRKRILIHQNSAS